MKDSMTDTDAQIALDNAQTHRTVFLERAAQIRENLLGDYLKRHRRSILEARAAELLVAMQLKNTGERLE